MKASTTDFSSISDPTDGNPVSDDTDLSDGSGAINISYPTESYNWFNLTASTTYYFKIYSYSNSGVDIDYKTDGTIVTASVTTNNEESGEALLANLVISEYVEGSSNNKYIEITNVTGSSIDLSNYDLAQYNNGGTTVKYTLSLGSENLESNSTFVIKNNSAVVWTGTADISTTKSLMTFNGNDVIALRKNEANIDVVGEIGISSDFAKDKTLRRKNGVEPTTTFDINNFTVLSTDVVDGLGIVAPLPVELTSFSGKAMNSGILLSWTTATEVNNYGFDVEKIQNKKLQNWETIGFVNGHGNSNSPKEYLFVDNSVSENVSYRLKQIDIDGNFEYSSVITISRNLDKTELFQNNPNTFNPSTTINYTLSSEMLNSSSTKVILKVYDTLGKEVATLVNENQNSGKHSVNFDASALSSGMYFYILKYASSFQTKKMLLIK